MFNPNVPSILCRTPELLKKRYGALRSRLTTVWRYVTEPKSGDNTPKTFEDYLDLSDPLDLSVYYWYKIMKENGDESIFDRQVKLIPGGAGVDTSNPQTFARSLAAASTHPQRQPLGNASGTGGSGKGSSTADKFLHELGELKKEVTKDDQKENSFWLMQNRDRAQDKVDKLYEKIESLDSEDEYEHRRKKRLISIYKCSVQEYVQLEKQVAEITGLDFDPEIAKNNAPFLDDEDVGDM